MRVNARRLAVKPWRRDLDPPYFGSIVFWMAIAFGVVIASLPLVWGLNQLYEIGVLPELLVGPISWVFEYVVPVISIAALASGLIAVARAFQAAMNTPSL